MHSFIRLLFMYLRWVNFNSALAQRELGRSIS